MTDISMVYVMLCAGGFLLALCAYFLMQEGVNAITVATMFSSSVICWLVSNLYTDGTLVDTCKFLSSNDSIVTMSNTVRDPAMSLLFQMLGIIFFIGTLMQVYDIIRSTRTLSEFDMGDEED